MSTKKRSIYWDNIKGVLIFLVVFAHCLYGLQDMSRWNNILVDAIYYFHMPAFVFVSGYFSKSRHSRSFEPLAELLVAYLILNGFFILHDALSGNQARLTSGYYSEWYLFCIIIWRLITPYLAKIRFIIPISFAISVLAGFWPDIDLRFYIVKIIVFFPFFLLGYKFSQESSEKIQSIRYYKRVVCGILFLIAAAILEYYSHKYLMISDSDLLPQPYDTIGFRAPAARLAIIAVSCVMIMAFLCLSFNRKIPVITKAGRNSLAIYLIHRPFTLLFYRGADSFSPKMQILAAVICTMNALIVFGSDHISGILNKVLNSCASAMSRYNIGGGEERQSHGKHRAATAFLSLLLCAVFVIPIGCRCYNALNSFDKTDGSSSGMSTDPIYRVMDDSDKDKYDKAFKILFAGDLILLEDQVKNAYTGTGYDFSPCFKYSKSYISEADYALGVFEGPMGGTDDKGYSNSNYDDGKELWVNFPDEWGKAVKEAGFDLVTTANNHVLDAGTEGEKRTIETLDKIGLDHTGSYRNSDEKDTDSVKIVERDGIRMAVLSYTFCVNNTSEDDLVNGDLSYVTSMIPGTSSGNYHTALDNVKRDFKKAKKSNPDLIIVLPHWGTQFADKPDKDQLAWEKNFKDLGADIILGDHTHSVQPVYIDNSNGKKTFTLYCPGNYANIYREYNGDCSSLVEVYVDRKTKDIIGGSVVPMWTESPYGGNYGSVPIYDILTDRVLGQTITTYDMNRVKEVMKHITSNMLGEDIGTDTVQKYYYFDENGFKRTRTAQLRLTGTIRQSSFYKLLKSSRSVCFVGDSVTEGTKNGGVPWYEPLESFAGGKVINCGWGSATIRTLLDDHLDEIVSAHSDLYVVAIGTNDIRYRNQSICAMTTGEYIKRLQKLRNAILKENTDAKFVFIAPWTSTDGDANSALGYQDKMKMNVEYSDALRIWCKSDGDIYIDPNVMINRYLTLYPQSNYLIDFIHPNSTQGVELYSKAVLEYR